MGVIARLLGRAPAPTVHGKPALIHEIFLLPGHAWRVRVYDRATSSLVAEREGRAKTAAAAREQANNMAAKLLAKHARAGE